MTHYFLGIDGGGSKTLAIIVDEHGQECGRGLAGSANYEAVGLEQAVQHLYTATETATYMAGCDVPLTAAWLGLAGMDRPGDYEMLYPHLRKIAQRVHLTNDAELVLSALDKAIGVALIAGTGSIALGRDVQGNSTRAGGWGHILGDEGSGYEIGRLALQAAMRAADGRGPMTVLLERIMDYWKLNDASDIIGRVYAHFDKGSIAQLAPLLLNAARNGDHIATMIVRQAADELALAVHAVSTKLAFAEMPVPLALGGGLLVHNTDFRMLVIERIRRSHPVEPVVIAEQPALNAARAAIHLVIM